MLIEHTVSSAGLTATTSPASTSIARGIGTPSTERRLDSASPVRRSLATAASPHSPERGDLGHRDDPSGFSLAALRLMALGWPRASGFANPLLGLVSVRHMSVTTAT